MEKIYLVLWSYTATAFCVVAVGAAAWAAAWSLRLRRSLVNRFRNWIEAVAIGFGFIAAAGKMGWMIQTIGGKTIEESLNNSISAGLAYLALFLGLFLWRWKKSPEE